MTTALGLAAMAVLILANGYFVAAEFGFVAVRRGHLEQRALEGDRRSVRALEVVKRLSFVLSGAQLGITVTSLATGYVAQPTLGAAFEGLLGALGVADRPAHSIGTILGFAAATALSMVFAELAPKNLAIARPEVVARRVASSIWTYTRVFGPIIKLFDGASNALLRLVHIAPVEELATGVTTDELDFIVEESGRSGVLTERQAALLQRVIDFPDLDASEIMVPRTAVASLPVTATGADLRRRLHLPFTRYPVVARAGDLDEVVGIVHAEDLLALPADRRDSVLVTSIMRPAQFVPESAHATALLDVIRRTGGEMVVVVDEYGGTAGILTSEDLVEELVGDITDEHDPAALEPRPLGDGSWWVPGRFRPDEVERDTGLVLPEDDDYDTVAGLVMTRLGRIPAVGDAVELDSVRITVTERRRHEVVGVLLEPLRVVPDPEASA